MTAHPVYLCLIDIGINLTLIIVIILLFYCIFLPSWLFSHTMKQTILKNPPKRCVFTILN